MPQAPSERSFRPLRKLLVDPLAYRYLADAAERLGHVAAAVDALVRYAALIDDRDIDPSINERLARLEQRLGRG